jgi:hypothetical protein
MGMRGAGLASGETSSTAMAPRSAPVSEWVTNGYAPADSTTTSKVAALPGPTT